MKKYIVFLLALAIFSFASCRGAKGADEAEEQWTVMPAGAKPSFMGIHGGTMPVSLLVAEDGSTLFTFVGRTGDDFLNALKSISLPLPTFGNATWSRGGSGRGARLFAGNATASLPVIAISGDALAACHLQPFGLSPEPLSIEGEAPRPRAFPHVKSLRPFFLPDYFRFAKAIPFHKSERP